MTGATTSSIRPRACARTLEAEPFADFDAGTLALVTQGHARRLLRHSATTTAWSSRRAARSARIVGGDTEDIPATRRFFLGGGGSIRGYEYRTVGPEIDGEVVGGLSFFETSLELRFRVTDTIGIVPFIDAGAAYEDPIPDFSEDVRIGAGIGLALPYAARAAPLRRRRAAQSGDGDNCLRLLCRTGASFLTMQRRFARTLSLLVAPLSLVDRARGRRGACAGRRRTSPASSASWRTRSRRPTGRSRSTGLEGVFSWQPDDRADHRRRPRRRRGSSSTASRWCGHARRCSSRSSTSTCCARRRSRCCGKPVAPAEARRRRAAAMSGAAARDRHRQHRAAADHARGAGRRQRRRSFRRPARRSSREEALAAKLTVDRQDRAGSLSADLRFEPAENVLTADLKLEEPEGGLVAELAAACAAAPAVAVALYGSGPARSVAGQSRHAGGRRAASSPARCRSRARGRLSRRSPSSRRRSRRWCRRTTRRCVAGESRRRPRPVARRRRSDRRRNPRRCIRRASIFRRAACSAPTWCRSSAEAFAEARAGGAGRAAVPAGRRVGREPRR